MTKALPLPILVMLLGCGGPAGKARFYPELTVQQVLTKLTARQSLAQGFMVLDSRMDYWAFRSVYLSELRLS
ncbi:MAG: hypothetical protein GY811_16600 [Myxococcales bacterium]|nr:hypothetical protein [Myxococcales bacterium]